MEFLVKLTPHFPDTLTAEELADLLKRERARGIELLKAMGTPHDNIILCDSKGVVHEGRNDGMNQWKSAHAVSTDRRSLADAVDGADVFLGLSVKGALTQDMVATMAP